MIVFAMKRNRKISKMIIWNKGAKASLVNRILRLRAVIVIKKIRRDLFVWNKVVTRYCVISV
jgi:hypothetical protein